MSEHRAHIVWNRTSKEFTYDLYNRSHEMRFDHDRIVVPASAAPAFKGDADRVDPEAAFVAALSSCHMLTLLAICARKRLAVDAYDDDASGVLEKGEGGKLWVAHVTLRPRVQFASGTTVDEATLAEIHHLAHEQCFIANSVKTEVTVEPRD